MLKKLRLAAVTATAVAGLAVAAAPGHAATIDPETPDCYVSCTKTLKPGERLVVGNVFAFNQVTIQGRESGFGSHFVIKSSPNGSTYTKVKDLYATAFSQTYSRALNPTLVPGYFRAIAINESTWANQTVTLSISAL
jgi:hypothetical protein